MSGEKKMKILSLISLGFLLLLTSCATSPNRSDGLLIDKKCNISRQCIYIADTQARIAAYVKTNRPDFSALQVHTNVSNGATNLALRIRDTWIPIGANKWFYFVCHSWHSEWNYPYCDIGDLSIGIDDTGRYYFCRTHVCGVLSFRLPASGKYADMVDFEKCNLGSMPLGNS
jgi:hypothetical protein